MVILDVGGGPGVYACWLAKQGYEVHLVDATPLHEERFPGCRSSSWRSLPKDQPIAIRVCEPGKLSPPIAFDR